MISQESVNKIKTSEAFIAMITKNFLNDPKCLDECKLAEELNKPMYAVIVDKEAWDELRTRYLWRKEYSPIENYAKLIKEDLQLIRAVSDFQLDNA